MKNATKHNDLEFYINENTAVIIKNNQAYFLEAEEEYDSYLEEFAEDESFTDMLTDRVIDYGRWGWCCASLRKAGTDHVTYLGHCSCKGAEDFIKNSGYFEYMLDKIETMECEA